MQAATHFRWMSMPRTQGSRLDRLLYAVGRQLDTLLDAVSRRLDTLHDAIGRRLDQVSPRLQRLRGIPARWTPYLLASAASAVLTWAALRGLLLLTGPHGALGWVGLGAVIAVAAVLLVLLARHYLLMKSEREDRRPFALSLLILAAAFAAALEALAGLTALVSRYGTFSAVPLSLRQCEQLYLWQSVGSVPRLRIPQRLGWAEPVQLPGVLGGVLVLAFKLILALLLLRTAVVIFQLAQQHRRSERAIELSLQRRSRGVPFFAPSSSAPLMTVAASVCLVYFTVGADSPVRTWLTGHLPNLHVLSLTIDAAAVSWLPAILAIVGIACLAYTVFGEGPELDRFPSPREAGGALLTCIAMALEILVAAAAILVVVHDFGWASLRPGSVGAGTTSGAALQVVAWHLAEALPGPDIPQTTHWTLQQDFTGPWAGLVIVCELMAVFLVLIFPVARVIAQWVHLSTPWVPPDPPLVEVPARVERDLNRAIAYFNRIGDDRLTLGAELLAVHWSRYELERARRSMWDLFGDGPVFAAADKAITKVDECYEALSRRPRFSSRRPPRHAPPPGVPEPATVRNAAEAVAAYERLAAHYRPPSSPGYGSDP
ncbi:hypothetical protein [Streptomyces sp. NPDC046197]|uniref:hypothetical protein n=1 Tax=Streptomyces sp. NPDC046197 TaxID=3154337 RepID=UPI00340B506E